MCFAGILQTSRYNLTAFSMKVTTAQRDCDKVNKKIPLIQELIGPVTTMLDKRKNSSRKERTRLIERLIRLFGTECIRYYFRIRQDFLSCNTKSSEDIMAWHLFHGLRLG